MCTLTAETGASLLREARLGLDHHLADVEHCASAARAVTCQSSGSWFVVEYVTSALYYISTMLGHGPRAKGTGCVALGEERRGRECDE